MSTYSEIIDDIVADLEKFSGKLGGLADEKIQWGINLAQEAIANRIQVKGQRPLTLTPNDEDYALPKNIKRIYYADRLESGLRLEIKVVSLDYLLNLRKNEGFSIRTNLSRPYCLAEFSKDGTRFIKVYPTADQRKDITLYVILRHNPRDHNDEDLSQTIQLPEFYDEAVKYYTEFLVLDWIGEEQAKIEKLQLFENEIKTLRGTIPAAMRVMVGYR